MKRNVTSRLVLTLTFSAMLAGAATADPARLGADLTPMAPSAPATRPAPSPNGRAASRRRRRVMWPVKSMSIPSRAMP